MCPVEARIARSQLPDSFLIPKFEVCFKQSNRPFGRGAKAKFFGGRGKQARFLNHCQRQSDDGEVKDGDFAECGNTLDICNLFPQILDGIVEVPRFRQCRTIGFKFLWCHGTVFVVEVIEHGTRRDIAETEIGVFQGAEKGFIDSGENLGSESSPQTLVESDVRDGLIVGTNDFCKLGGCGIGRCIGSWARVHRDKKRYTSAGDVVFLAEEHGEVAMIAAAAGRVDSTGIGEQLALEELQRGIGGFANDWRQHLVWKIELRGGSHGSTGGVTRRAGC